MINLNQPTLFLGPVRSWQHAGPRPRTLWTEDRRDRSEQRMGWDRDRRNSGLDRPRTEVQSSVGPAQASVDPILFGRPEVGSDRHISALTQFNPTLSLE